MVLQALILAGFQCCEKCPRVSYRVVTGFIGFCRVPQRVPLIGSHSLRLLYGSFAFCGLTYSLFILSMCGLIYRVSLLSDRFSSEGCSYLSVRSR